MKHSWKLAIATPSTPNRAPCSRQRIARSAARGDRSRQAEHARSTRAAAASRTNEKTTGLAPERSSLSASTFQPL